MKREMSAQSKTRDTGNNGRGLNRTGRDTPEDHAIDHLSKAEPRTYKRTVSILLDGGIYERIKWLAQKEKVSVSEWIRVSLEFSLFQDLRHGRWQWE